MARRVLGWVVIVFGVSVGIGAIQSLGCNSPPGYTCASGPSPVQIAIDLGIPVLIILGGSSLLRAGKTKETSGSVRPPAAVSTGTGQFHSPAEAAPHDHATLQRHLLDDHRVAFDQVAKLNSAELTALHNEQPHAPERPDEEG